MVLVIGGLSFYLIYCLGTVCDWLNRSEASFDWLDYVEAVCDWLDCREAAFDRLVLRL